MAETQVVLAKDVKAGMKWGPLMIVDDATNEAHGCWLQWGDDGTYLPHDTPIVVEIPEKTYTLVVEGLTATDVMVLRHTLDPHGRATKAVLLAALDLRL